MKSPWHGHFSFGFPSSLGLAQMPQLDPSLPAYEKGIVAGKNLKRRALVLDCPSFKETAVDQLSARRPRA